MTKKGRQLFGVKKVHPRENPGYAYGPTKLSETAPGPQCCCEVLYAEKV